MVYIRNIINAHSSLGDEEMVCLLTKSNRRIFIEKADTLEKVGGDLKIKKTTCYCYLDVNEVETVIVAKEKIIRGV